MTIIKGSHYLLTAVGTVISFILLNAGVYFWEKPLAEQRQANLLQSPSNVAKTKDEVVRYDLSVGEDLNSYWGYIPNAIKYRLVIVSGMSQMYAINDRRNGDQTIVEWIDDNIAQHGARAFGLAAPNMCNEEALLLLLGTINYPETKPATFVYGVCFDKFRNVDLRPGMQRFLKARPELKDSWIQLAETKAKEFPLATEKMRRSLEAVEGAGEAQGEKRSFEARLRERAGRIIPVVAARTDLNAWLQGQLFLFRNWVLSIKPTSKRPQIKGRYQMNQQFLELMVQVAQQNDVRIILYVIPLNPLADNPYVPEEYLEFKRWLEMVSNRYKVPFANLESIVPSDSWGETMGGPDFKHFKGEGHKKTAEELLRLFRLFFIRDMEASY